MILTYGLSHSGHHPSIRSGVVAAWCRSRLHCLNNTVMAVCTVEWDSGGGGGGGGMFATCYHYQSTECTFPIGKPGKNQECGLFLEMFCKSDLLVGIFWTSDLFLEISHKNNTPTIMMYYVYSIYSIYSIALQ